MRTDPRSSNRLLVAVGSVALIGIVLVGCSSTASDSGASTTPADRSTTSTTDVTTRAGVPATSRPVGDEVGGWTRLPDWPLAPRTDTSAVWTGDELVFLGGSTNTCPPNADCVGSREPPRSDGAALDPDTGQWRSIADAPVPLGWLDAVAAGDDLYVLQHASGGSSAIDGPPAQEASFLRYSPQDDEWAELTVPTRDDSTSWYALTAVGDDLVAGPGTDEHGTTPVRWFDAATQTWTDLPDDPLPELYDRYLSYDDGFLYLTGKEVVDQPGSDGPSLVLAARYDVHAGDWQELPTSESIGAGLWPAGHGMLANPALGGADGGEVNGWDRWYPEGALFDTASLTWQPLPRPPGTGDGGRGDRALAVGLINGDRSGYSGTGGWAYDGPNRRWVEVPAAPGDSSQGRSVAAAGPRAVVYGGGDWSHADGVRPLDEIWMWTPPG